MSTRPFELACAGWTNTSANELRSQIVECSHIVEQYGGSDYQLAVLAKMYLRLNRLRIGDVVAAGDRLRCSSSVLGHVQEEGS